MVHRATIHWERQNADFTDNRYSRAHRWSFDGGVEVRASASPGVVPIPYADPAAVDPEEAFVAALASCHMLFFLAVCAKKGYVVNEYRDRALGLLGRNDDGHLAMVEITLRPHVTFEGPAPDAATMSAMHRETQTGCFLRNSVRTRIVCDPVLPGEDEAETVVRHPVIASRRARSAAGTILVADRE